MKKNTTGKIIIGGIFFLANSLIIGCDSADDQVMQGGTRSFGDNAGSGAAYQQSGVMTMVEEIAPDEFRIDKEYPSKTTGVVVSRLDGTKEVIPEEKLPAIMEQQNKEKGMGLGSVLAAGMVGYMMGKNSSLSPYVYKDDNLYKQSLLNRQLFYRQQEEEDKRRGYTGGYWSGGRYYNPSRSAGGGQQVGRPGTGSAKTGFFSRLGSSFRGLS
ncbi:MAG: hypothetical protein CVU71_05280 [Deltaproteobacteria bacterium HGW-Deltaproteobacteria-6]|nr:MAG: hypothetical protein CVU71_05280 [Deltaproteobacteria bacterium HGW-Deltaproteobacteria-6]